MVVQKYDIDIKESTLRRKGDLLNILLTDQTTKRNIIWGTDSYEQLGKEFVSIKPIKTNLVTGKYNLLIQPRAAKSSEEQRRRTKDRGEVFTPLKIVDQMNKALEIYRPSKTNWQEYICKVKLEIACGEAPFIVSRYNPTAQGSLIKLASRVGFLDKKLRAVSKYCHDKKDWLYWAKEAFKASYGYEWQGDNVLLARENLLYTLIDYYEAKFGRKPTLKVQEEFAKVISWNIFQMDGLRYVIPMSCHHEERMIYGESTLFGKTPDKVEKYECEGCKYNRIDKHNGIYVKIMDWKKNEVVIFKDIV